MRADVDLTAWSHGQITAKLWLAEILENLYEESDPLRVAFYGGWYGLAPFLLLSRGRLPIESVRSFDVDPECESIADKLNTTWVYDRWKFKAVTADVNTFNWYEEYNWIPHLVINTSTEHFSSDKWFHSILPSMCIAIQSNNQEHETHTSPVRSLEDLKSRFRMRNILYEGMKTFEYPDKSYQRFMLVGYK